MARTELWLRLIYFKDEWRRPQHVRIEIGARLELIYIEVIGVALKAKTGHGARDRAVHRASNGHRDVENIVGCFLGK